MNILYDSHTDTLTLSFSNEKILDSDEDKPGIIIDYGAKGKIVEMEILNASQRVTNPQELNFRVIGSNQTTLAH